MELTDESDSDLIPLPPPRKGRPVRNLENPFSRIVKSCGAKCRECPKWLPRTSVCVVRGCSQAPDALACRYGHILIMSRRNATRKEAKR